MEKSDIFFFTNPVCGGKIKAYQTGEGNHYIGDIGDKQTLEDFAKYVIDKYGHVDFLINNAPPIMRGITDCSYEDFSRAIAVGVTAPFYLSKLFTPYFREGAALAESLWFSLCRIHTRI